MNKRHVSKNKQYNSRKDRSDSVNYDIEHYESDPGDAKIFIERMMVLGYTYETIVEQTILKYKEKRNNAQNMVKNIRSSWIAYGSLDSEEKKSILEQQLNHLFRECLTQKELGTAAIVMKRKLELAGIDTKGAAKSVNVNLGMSPEQLLPPDLVKERQDRIKQIEEDALANKKEDK